MLSHTVLLPTASVMNPHVNPPKKNPIKTTCEVNGFSDYNDQKHTHELTEVSMACCHGARSQSHFSIGDNTANNITSIASDNYSVMDTSTNIVLY